MGREHMEQQSSLVGTIPTIRPQSHTGPEQRRMCTLVPNQQSPDMHQPNAASLPVEPAFHRQTDDVWMGGPSNLHGPQQGVRGNVNRTKRSQTNDSRDFPANEKHTGSTGESGTANGNPNNQQVGRDFPSREKFNTIYTETTHVSDILRKEHEDLTTQSPRGTVHDAHNPTIGRHAHVEKSNDEGGRGSQKTVLPGGLHPTERETQSIQSLTALDQTGSFGRIGGRDGRNRAPPPPSYAEAQEHIKQHPSRGHIEIFGKRRESQVNEDVGDPTSDNKNCRPFPWLFNVLSGKLKSKIPKLPRTPPLKFVIHAPKVGIVDLEKVHDLCKRTNRLERMKYVEEIIFPETPPPTPQSLGMTVPVSFLRSPDIPTIIENDIVEQAPEETVINTRVFLSEEATKARARLITHPIVGNKHAESYNPEVPLMDVLDVIRMVFRGRYAGTFDIKGAFYNFTIPEKSRNWYVFTVTIDGMIYKFRMKRMPMGHRAAPEILMSTVLSVMEVVVIDTKANVTYYIHIDNGIIIHEDAAVVDSILERVITLLKDLGFAMGEVNRPSEKVHFLGFEMDFQNKTVSLLEKGRSKLREARETLSNKHMTVRDYFEILGRLNYYSRALWNLRTSGPHRADHYTVISELQVIAQKFTIGELTLNSDIEPMRGHIINYLDDIYNTGLVRPVNDMATIQMTIITDATPAFGAGMSVVIGNDVWWKAKEWSEDEKLLTSNELELRTLGVTAGHIKTRFGYTHIRLATWVTDNDVGRNILISRQARSSAMNNQLNYCLRALSQANIFIAKSIWVPTDKMPCDNLSRGAKEPNRLDNTLLEALLGRTNLIYHDL